MKLEDVKVICISYRILADMFTTGIPSICCMKEEDIQNAIAINKHYRIILVCPAEYVQQLQQLIISPDVREVFIFGYYPQAKVGDRNVKVVNAKERPLRLSIAQTARNYIHEEEIQLRKSGQQQKANQFAEEIRRLSDLIESLYLQPF